MRLVVYVSCAGCVLTACVLLVLPHYHHQGIATNKIPHELHYKQQFWDWIYSDTQRAEQFGEAMIQLNHVGGSAVAKALRDQHLDCIIDVAGGQGGFMAALLESTPKLKLGMVFDRPEAIRDAKKVRVGWWDGEGVLVCLSSQALQEFAGFLVCTACQAT